MIDFISRNRRRSVRAAAIVACLLLCATVAHAATRVLLHATLLRSTPAANGRLATPPDTIRLVFSEQVVPELSQITLTGPDGITTQLQIANDPHDVHTLVGRVASASSGGRYKVSWRVISADGHRVGGTFNYFVGAAAADTARVPIVAPSLQSAKPAGDSAVAVKGFSPPPPAAASAPEQKSVPVFASLLRGLGLGAFMSGVGLLFFGVTSGERRAFTPRAFIVRAIALGALLLVAHFFAWLQYLSPTGSLNGDFIASMLDTRVGRVELIRTLLAVLALWGIGLARHDKIALTLGAACLIVSGAIGHPAAIHPYWTIPAKSLHLLAAAVWVGGLIWLVWLSRRDEAACRAEARRVSSLALVSVIVIFLSGLLETVFFLNAPGDLIRSDYGRLVLAKMIGLGILVGYGAYNRFGLLPEVDAVSGTAKLSRSVRQEIMVVTLVILIGGFLAYVPTPPPARSAATTGASQ